MNLNNLMSTSYLAVLGVAGVAALITTIASIAKKKTAIPLAIYGLCVALLLGGGYFMSDVNPVPVSRHNNQEEELEQRNPHYSYPEYVNGQNSSVSDADLPSEEPESPAITEISDEELAKAAEIADAITAALPQEYTSNKWFLNTCLPEWDDAVTVSLQIDQMSDDPDAALALAAEYFDIAKNKVEEAGTTLDRFDIVVVNNGSPVGWYITRDGENYTVIADGKSTEITISEPSKPENVPETTQTRPRSSTARVSSTTTTQSQTAQPQNSEAETAANMTPFPDSVTINNQPVSTPQPSFSLDENPTLAPEPTIAPMSNPTVLYDPPLENQAESSNVEKTQQNNNGNNISNPTEGNGETSSSDAYNANNSMDVGPETTVYVSDYSSKIHSIPNCSGMKNYQTMTKAEADAHNYEYCKDCW